MYLNLLYNDIGDKGVIVFGLVIKCNVILDFLDVSWNSICVKGVQVLVEGLKMNI